MMKRIIALALLLVSTASFAGQCDYSWQTAKDGKRCGGRAADQKPGGR